MLRNYLKIAARTLLRRKGYAFINIFGLAVGLACSFFIVLWVVDEIGYDRFHEHRDDLYRVMRHVTLGGQTYTWTPMPKPVADVLDDEYPEVEDVILLTFQNDALLTHGDQTHREEGHYAGPAFFQSFSFPLLVGDPATVLNQPDAIAISDRVARKFFGEDWRTRGNVLGEVITVDHRKDFRITGVFEDVPEHSTLRFDYVIAVEDYLQRNTWLEHWGNSAMQIYVKLRSGSSAEDLNVSIADLLNRHNEYYQEGMAGATVFLKPFDEIHLYSDYRDGKLQGGRIDLIRIFGIVAVFLVLIAAINFMNLATARSAQRAKEVGVRKTIGAGRAVLIRRFLTESLLLSGGIVRLLSAEFVRLVIIAALIATPLAYFGASRWLENFAYRVALGPGTLIAAGMAALAVAMLTVAYHAWQAATMNPAESVRYE